jgi:hypothetical protein
VEDKRQRISILEIKEVLATKPKGLSSLRTMCISIRKRDRDKDKNRDRDREKER